MEINIYPISDSYGGKYMEHCIRPASGDIPEWYRTSNSYVGDLKNKKRLHERMTIKKCIPVLDMLSSGLNLYLPFTLFVEGNYPERDIYTNAESNSPATISLHDINQVQNFPLPKSFDPQPYKINFPYIIKTPRGYSSVYLQPQNELQDIFLFPRALVNTDNYDNQVNFPFFIKKDFSGTIEADSHFLTVIFVKREKQNFNFKEHSEIRNKFLVGSEMVQNWGRGFYKKTRF